MILKNMYRQKYTLLAACGMGRRCLRHTHRLCGAKEDGVRVRIYRNEGERKKRGRKQEVLFGYQSDREGRRIEDEEGREERRLRKEVGGEEAEQV